LPRPPAARHRAYGAITWRGDGDRGDPARGRVRDGAARADAQGRVDRPRPGGRPGVPQRPDAGPDRPRTGTPRTWLTSCSFPSRPTSTSSPRGSEGAPGPRGRVSRGATRG